MPDRPVTEVLPEMPPFRAVYGCLSSQEATIAPGEACPPGSRPVAILEARDPERLDAWGRDVRDAYARMRARVDDYIRRAEHALSAR